MKARYVYAMALILLSSFITKAQVEENMGQYYTPYLTGYVPTGAPEWMVHLNKPEGLNYKAMVDSFNVYLQNNPKARIKTPDTKHVVNHFRRFQKAYSRFADKDGIIRLPKASQYRDEVNDLQMATRPENRKKSMGMRSNTGDEWRVISPFVTYDIQHKKETPAQSNVLRVCASRSNPNVLYCGTEPGLMFKSTDKAQSWTVCNDGEWMAGEIRALDISHTNENKVFMGAGGICWITTDGGDNWTNVTPQPYDYTDGNYNPAYVAKFYPENDNVILVGTGTCLYRTTNGGKTWSYKLSGRIFDIQFSKQNPKVCYAAVRQQNTVLLYKSTDAGENWTQLTITTRPLLSAHIGLSEAPNGADYVYVFACSQDVYSNYKEYFLSGLAYLYKSTDGGASFIEHNHSTQVEYADKWGGQGYYCMVCVASPTNPEHVIVGLCHLYHSTDGGATITNKGGYYGQFDLHCDQQSIMTNGANDTWLSTDGGVVYSNDFFGNHAETRSYGIYASEMWGFDQGWNEDVIAGGRNHNGNMSQHMDLYNGASIYMKGSECPTGYVFLSNPRKVFYSDASYPVIMPDDFRNEFTPVYNFWVHPFESSQFGIGFEYDPCYAQCFYLVQGTYDGEFKTFWRTRNDGFNFSEVYKFPNAISSVAVSRSNPDKLVVGTQGMIYYSLDAGKTFTAYTIPFAMTQTYNYKIAIHPRNEDEIWVSDCNPGGMWVTKDNGATWNKFDKGLTINSWKDNLEKHAVGRFFLTGNEKNAAYAIAYTFGYMNYEYMTTRSRVLYCDDTTDGWVLYNDGFPQVMNQNRMLPFYMKGVIRVATNQGVWERDLADKEFKPVAQPLLLNVGSGDNTKSDYPSEIQLESYSIVNQTDAEWEWTISPQPVFLTSDKIRNPKIRIQPDQTYDITLRVKTPGGDDSKTIRSMIKGTKPAPGATSIAPVEAGREIVFASGNAIKQGDDIVLNLHNIAGHVDVCLYAMNGSVAATATGSEIIRISTANLTAGGYFYYAVDQQGYKYAGKLTIQ